MAQQDTFIAASNRLHASVQALALELTRQRDRAIAERDRAIAERDRAIAERDAALEGETGDVDLRSYCESCNKLWHRDYVTWFKQPYHNDAGASCYSACGNCMEQVPQDQEAVA
jgi:hypothetical protein